MSTGAVELNGMVLRSDAAGEYDRRVTLLTRERGKITAFARGARRSGSALLAATVPFAFGTFRLYEGRSAYTCVAAEISNYFQGLKTDIAGACFGEYFMEFADYYTRENLDAKDTLNLLYVALTALERDDISDELVRYAFEVRIMTQAGEYPLQVTQDESLALSARQAFYHMITAPLGRLFSFRVSDDTLREIIKKQDQIREKIIDRPFRSLGVLESMLSFHT